MSDKIDILLPARDDISEDARASWLVRSTQAGQPADISQGTLPHIVGEFAGDILLPIYSNIDKIERAFVVRGMTGERLVRYARERLAPNPDGSIYLPATGASGYMEATKIATGGAYIVAGTVVRHRPTNTVILVAVTDTYLDGDPIPIVCETTGPTTNLVADAPLLFDSPPPGVSQTAVVLAQSDGNGALVGLTGGRDQETDEELQDRVIEAQSNPPAAGNSAQIVLEAQRTPTVPVQKAFVIPAWFGSGTACVVFTLRPDASASRIPNGTQIGLVNAHINTEFPTDFNLCVATVLPQTVAVQLGVTWISGANGWTDLAPWPEYITSDSVVVDGAVTIATGAFRVTRTLSGTAPKAGTTIGLYDVASGRWKRKRVLTVSTVVSGKSWDLTFTSDLGVSDTYVPTAGALVSPWSPSLQRVAPQIATYFQGLGPGEQFATFPDPGGRQRRWPVSPEQWPSTVANEGLVSAAKASGAISDVEVLAPATPYATTVGTPGVSVYLLQLGDLAVYPQT